MTSSELEKERALNEKLENDLLQMETHNPKPVNTESVSEDADALAGLELGKKIVRLLPNLSTRGLTLSRSIINRGHLQEAVPYHSHRLRILPFCPS